MKTSKMISKKFLEFKRAIIFFAIVFFVLLLSSIAVKEEDTYNRTFIADDLMLNAGSNTVKEGTGSAGMVTSGPLISLPEGKYKVTISYAADMEGNYAEFWTTNNNTDNVNITWDNDGKLSPESNSKEMILTFTDHVSDLEVCTFYGGTGTFTVNSINITCLEGMANCHDSVYIPVLIFLTMIAWYLVYTRLSQQGKKAIVLLTLTVIIASAPCYLSYLIDGHDLVFEVNRITGISSALKSGQFPVRIHADTYGGYGYASSIFYPELLLYIPAFLYNIGFSLVSSIHIFLVLINAGTVGIMFFVVLRMSKSTSTAIMASILYGLATFRLVYVFLMNGYGSASAMMFIPLVIYGFYELMAGNKKRWGYLVCGVTGVLQTHILSMLLTFVVLLVVFIFCAFRTRELGRFVNLLKSILATLFLNAWFLVPFIMFYFSEIDNSSLAAHPYNRALSLTSILSIWGHSEMGIQVRNRALVGVPVLLDLSIMIGLAVYFIALSKNKVAIDSEQKTDKRKMELVLLGLGIFLAFMTTKYFPWNILEENKVIGEIVRMIQHPQRLFSIAVPCLCIVAAIGYYKITEENRNLVILFVFAISVMTSTMFLSEYSSGDIKMYKGEVMNSYINTQEYLYPGTQFDDLVPNTYKFSEDAVQIDHVQKNGTTIVLDYTAKETSYIDLPLLFYPGYKAQINNETIGIIKSENNQIRILLQEGTKGKLKVYFNGFKVWKVADLISVMTALYFISSCIIRKRRFSVTKRGSHIEE